MNESPRDGAAARTATERTYVAGEVLEALFGARLSPDPWPHAYLPRTLSPGTARRLAAEFPSASLRRAHRLTGEKTYRLGTLALDVIAASDTGRFRELAKVLRSANYRAAVERLTGVNLAGSRLELHVWEYVGGDWLAPHRDKPDKLVTQIFYLSASWSPHHAGRLLIFDGTQAPREVAVAYPPIAGSSAVLVRSAASWHAVEAPSATSPPRRSVTATFFRPSSD